MHRQLWLAGGATAFALGMIGIVLPIMPTVPFLLLAAFCFSRSHPHLAERLYRHPRYGPAMRNWRDRRAISRKAKLSAVAAMAIGVGFTWYAVGWPWVLVSVAVLVIVGTWICTRRE
ncbi:MAG: YbaN family protein [Novosphingobium sp.]|nr:YbaN family protein [Novosphingobium sp.]